MLLKSKSKQDLKKVVMLAVLATSISTMASTSVNSNVKLYINDVRVELSNKPVIDNGFTYIPLRALSDGLGMSVQWNASTKSATIKHNLDTIEIRQGSSLANKNNIVVDFKTPVKTINGSIYVPLKFLSNVLGAELNYSSADKTVYIKSDDLVVSKDIIYSTEAKAEPVSKYGKAFTGRLSKDVNEKPFSEVTIVGRDKFDSVEFMGYTIVDISQDKDKIYYKYIQRDSSKTYNPTLYLASNKYGMDYSLKPDKVTSLGNNTYLATYTKDLAVKYDAATNGIAKFDYNNLDYVVFMDYTMLYGIPVSEVNSK